ncbi:MAG: xylB [Actinomycetia bacterium]|nr:xylB [Actinomycetes bacterium]
MSVVVGVDLGTGSARAVAVDRDGLVIASTSSPYDGRAQWAAGHADPQSWRRAVGDALDGLSSELADARHPDALGAGGQSVAVVTSDGADAVTVLHPAAAGDDPHDAHRELWAVLGSEHPGTVPLQTWDWILTTLGAERHQSRWPGGRELEGFGPVIPTGTVAGTADGDWGVARGTPLVAGSADAYMAFWAGGIDTPGRALDPGGRTGGIGIAVAGSEAAPTGYALRSAARGVDIVGGAVTAHGLAIEWWSRMTGRPVEELLDEAAAVPPGSGGLLALPYFEGERSPRWERALRAELVGLDARSTPGQVTRALLEGSAYGLRHIVDTLALDGVELERLMVSGSPARSRLWSQIKADVLGVPVEVPEFPELAARGAALAAGAAIGWWPRPGEGAPGSWPVGARSVLEPATHDVYDDAYARWVQLGDVAQARLGERRVR